MMNIDWLFVATQVITFILIPMAAYMNGMMHEQRKWIKIFCEQQIAFLSHLKFTIEYYERRKQL